MSENKNGLIDPIQPNHYQITLLKAYQINQTSQFRQGPNHKVIEVKS